MAQINLSNSKGRDAVVDVQGVNIPLRVRWVDAEGRQAAPKRVLRATAGRDYDVLLKAHEAPEKVGEALVAGDPEIDIESYGAFLRDTSRVYVNPDGEVVHKIVKWDILHNVDRTERERRPHVDPAPNAATETPLRWSGKLMKKSEVYNRFVFSTKMQVRHVNGLTYDFLHAMAKELEEQQSLMLLGAGPKSNQPLVFRRGGAAYRGFLEGRTEGDRYALILHLSNMELKAPEAQPRGEEEQ